MFKRENRRKPARLVAKVKTYISVHGLVVTLFVWLVSGWSGLFGMMVGFWLQDWLNEERKEDEQTKI